MPTGVSAIQQTSVVLGPSLGVSNTNSSSDIQPDVPMQLPQSPEETNTMDLRHEEESTEPHHGRFSQETVSHVKDTSEKIWRIINETVQADSVLTPAHIINYVFPNPVSHQTTYWNIFCAKYRIDHPNKDWDLGEVSEHFTEFKAALLDDQWKEILWEYAKLDYHSRWNSFEAILALVGANPKIDRPSIVGLHETELSRGSADQKLCLKNDWAGTHLQAYVHLLMATFYTNKKSDMVIKLHWQQGLDPEDNKNVMPAPQYSRDSSSLPYVESTTDPSKRDDGNKRTEFVPFKILWLNDPKSAQTSHTVNMMAFYKVPMWMKAPQNTHDDYPDYRQCPWKHLRKPLREWNMLLVGWPPSLPLPISDENDLTSLSKGALSLSDSQKILLAKVLEESEIWMIHMDVFQYVLCCLTPIFNSRACNWNL
ncbi:hypothetical protein ARMGADRAFT_1038766 [Armillaria gallica]|uniref:Uncharacterized protein n=1 Tax=Armillaria gallica TaxID=47427 RepID=A0A2H3CV56_ARMGA|nr:hypothetical protein ARMGADRAFT_1038766 [Armillaria gallica]